MQVAAEALSAVKKEVEGAAAAVGAAQAARDQALADVEAQRTELHQCRIREDKLAERVADLQVRCIC
jgi:chromosome segregation ATPase